MSHDNPESHSEFLPLEFCSLDRAVRMFSKYGLEKEDIEHWIALDIIHPSVHLNGHTVVAHFQSQADLEIEKMLEKQNNKSKKEIRQAAVNKQSFGIEYHFEDDLFSTHLLKVEFDEELHEELEVLLFESNGTREPRENMMLAKAYGIWKLDHPPTKSMAFLSPSQSYSSFSIVTLEYLNLPLVLEYSELQKIQIMCSKGKRFSPPSHSEKLKRIDTVKKNLEELINLSPVKQHRVDPSPAKMIISLLELLPSINSSVIAGNKAALMKAIELEFKKQNKTMPVFEEATLRKWIKKASE